MAKNQTEPVRSLKIQARVSIPMSVSGGEAGQVDADFVSFSGLPADEEHVALVFEPMTREPLVRIHSECLTGDVFHSLRCDCRLQLEEAISQFSGQGGILIYLRQEGRGIGLGNKLRAYELQDKGFDTYEANTELGLEEDARDFTVAADMLRTLDIETVRLVTNNPNKVDALKRAGITVAETIATKRYASEHNRRYLDAKAIKGHKFGD